MRALPRSPASTIAASSVNEVPKEAIPDFESWGIRAFTTTRDAGSFGLSGSDPVNEVMGRWTAVRDGLAETAPRLVLHRGPPPHDFVDGIAAGEAERSSIAGGRE